jgi:phospholipase/lecithinase/hemolysin
MKALRIHRPYSLILALLLALWALPSQADSYSRMVIFGDSLSDPGNAFALTGELSNRPYTLIPSAPYARGGLHFSNGNTWAEDLGTKLGVAKSVGPALRAPAFSNYAVGGARARPGGAMDLTTQVGLFLASYGNNAPGDALYVIFIGGNDIRDAMGWYIDPGYQGPTPDVVIGTAIQSIADNIQLLLAAGAHHVLVVNAPNLGVVPAVAMNGPQAQYLGQTLSAGFNFYLNNALTMLQLDPRLSLLQFDLFAFLNQAVAVPASLGLTEVSTPCITPGVVVGAVCNNPKSYLFWDGIHPTAAGHRLISDAVYNVIVAP